MQEEGLLAAASLTGGRLLRAGNHPDPIFARSARSSPATTCSAWSPAPRTAIRTASRSRWRCGGPGRASRAPRTVRLPPETDGLGDPVTAGAHAALPDRHPGAARPDGDVRVPRRGEPAHANPGRGGSRRSGRRRLSPDARLSPARSGGHGRVDRDPAGYAAAGPSGPDGPVLEVTLPIPVASPGRYALRVAVIDAAGTPRQRGAPDPTGTDAGRPSPPATCWSPIRLPRRPAASVPRSRPASPADACWPTRSSTPNRPAPGSAPRCIWRWPTTMRVPSGARGAVSMDGGRARRP